MTRGTLLLQHGTSEQNFVVLIGLTDHTGATWLDAVGPYATASEAEAALHRVKNFCDTRAPFAGNITVNVVKPEQEFMTHLQVAVNPQ